MCRYACLLNDMRVLNKINCSLADIMKYFNDVIFDPCSSPVVSASASTKNQFTHFINPHDFQLVWHSLRNARFPLYWAMIRSTSSPQSSGFRRKIYNFWDSPFFFYSVLLVILSLWASLSFSKTVIEADPGRQHFLSTLNKSRCLLKIFLAPAKKSL